MKTLKNLIAAGAVAAACAITNNTANATLVFDLGSIISGGTPGAPAPWLRATITQDGANAVQIKMDAIALSTTPTIEAVKDWAFNLNPNISTASLSAAEVARSGSFNPSPITAISSANGYGGFAFDFDFDFSTAGGGAATRFTQGDSVTIKLSRAAGLLESDFNYTADNGGASYYSGAHIITLANGTSAFVGAAVPEPSTYAAGALLLIPVLVQIRRKLRGNQA